MAAGPNIPTTKKGKNIIMAQGHTAGPPSSYGLDPFFEGTKGVGDEPEVLRP